MKGGESRLHFTYYLMNVSTKVQKIDSIVLSTSLAWRLNNSLYMCLLYVAMVAF